MSISTIPHFKTLELCHSINIKYLIPIFLQHVERAWRKFSLKFSAPYNKPKTKSCDHSLKKGVIKEKKDVIKEGVIKRCQ